jgi:hypothetical protein
MDGGYDCKTVIITTGEIMESLKVNYIKPNVVKEGNSLLKNEFAGGSNISWIPSYSENALAGMWAEAYYKSFPSLNPGVSFPPSSSFKQENVYGITNFYISSNTDNEKSLSRQNSNVQHYITLDLMFDLMNKYIIARCKQDDQPLVSLSLKDTYNEDLKCSAHPLQVSVDPGICLIKSPKWYEEQSFVAEAITSASLNADVAAARTVYDDLQVEANLVSSIGFGSTTGQPDANDRFTSALDSIRFSITNLERLQALIKLVETNGIKFGNEVKKDLSSALSGLLRNTNGMYTTGFKQARVLKVYFDSLSGTSPGDVKVEFTGDSSIHQGLDKVNQDNYLDNYVKFRAFDQDQYKGDYKEEVRQQLTDNGLIKMTTSYISLNSRFEDIGDYIGVSNFKITVALKTQGTAASQVVIAQNGQQALSNLKLLLSPKVFFKCDYNPGSKCVETFRLKPSWLFNNCIYLIR